MPPYKVGEGFEDLVRVQSSTIDYRLGAAAPLAPSSIAIPRWRRITVEDVAIGSTASSDRVVNTHTHSVDHRIRQVFLRLRSIFG